MSRKITITFEDYNLKCLDSGMKELGFVKGIGALTDEQLSIMLSFALGYVHYQKISILKEMLREAGVEF